MHTITSPNTTKNAIPAVPTTTATIIPISINAATNAPNNNIFVTSLSFVLIKRFVKYAHCI